eukprot:g4266.t1
MTAKATAGPQYQDLTGEIQHLKSLAKPTPEAPWEYSFVIGTFQEASQARRSFLSYLHLERPGRRSPMVHYNSWYDFYSYQDEGFNGEEMVTKRKTKLDSSLWEFDQQRFPRRFDEVAKRAKDFGAGTGVWLSPWGGYGFTQEARVKFGKKQGYETNYNKNIQSEGFSLAGKKYQKAFHETAMRFRREQGVNMFKFDGVAGNPTELAMEMEAMLRTLAQLRNQKSQKDDEDWGKNERTGNRRNMTPSGRLATVTATRRPERSSFTRRPSGGPPGTWKNTDGGPRVTADLGLELAGGLEDWLVGPATSVVRLEVRMEGEGETTCVS